MIRCRATSSRDARQDGARFSGPDVIDDRTALRFEIVDERTAALPIDEGPGARYRGDPLTNRPGGFGWILRAGEDEAQAPLRGRVAVADLDQELGGPLGAERFEVLGR
jgi:hypothetical protein